MAAPGVTVIDELRRVGAARGALVALTLAPEVGLGLATVGGGWSRSVGVDDPASVVRAVEDELRPRWVLWSNETAVALVHHGVRVATCWDVAAVHRLLFGGWRADPARVWAHVHGLPLATMPTTRPLDLFSQVEHGDADPDGPLRSDGHLSAEWVGGGWAESPERLARWAELAAEVTGLQQERLAELDGPGGATAVRATSGTAADRAGRTDADRGSARAAAAADRATSGTAADRGSAAARSAATARSESAAELLCAEMSVDGLPLDRSVAEEIIGDVIGPRPRSESEAAVQRGHRDAEVLRHAPADSRFDLRSPGQVKSLLRRVGIEVPDTRAWRLEAMRDAHPLVDALLAWRKAERVATTYGYGWLDENLDPDGRLRGAWSGSDGAAGRMTASAGLHNMPADMRGAVVAETGHVFVRADLGQIEPRVLASVSGDRALARATQADDMYAPVATDLDVDRATAKVAVLGAMYGQTTGHGAQALRRLNAAYPVAMAYLEEGDRSGQAGRDLRTYGGRLVRMGGGSPGAEAVGAPEVGDRDREARGRAAARGRYGRNALVQGAAAELFKVWAVTVRARGAEMEARIVLCLHDELLLHVPVAHGDAAARLLEDCLQEAAHRWAPDASVRFVAEINVIPRWSDAKG